jgi:hypothetical protein
MAGISFVLTGSKSLEEFSSLVDTVLETHDSINEQLVLFLKKKAQEAGIHALDFHPTMLRLLQKHSGLGLRVIKTPADETVIACHACGNMLHELAWRCPYCDCPLLDLVGMRLRKIELSGEPRKFVESRRGEWSHGDWLSFKGSVEWNFGLVPEDRLGSLLEKEKAAYWAEEERSSWEMSCASGTRESYLEYLRRFPYGFNADGARERLAKLERGSSTMSNTERLNPMPVRATPEL